MFAVKLCFGSKFFPLRSENVNLHWVTSTKQDSCSWAGFLIKFVSVQAVSERLLPSLNSQANRVFMVTLKLPSTKHHRKNKHFFSTQVCSVWLPVDPVSTHTCLRLVKGSHRSPDYFKPVHFDGPPFTCYEIKPGDEEKAKQFLPAPDVDGDEQFQVLSWDMEVIAISFRKSPV